MGIDYKWSLRRGPDDIGEDEYEKVKSECHARNAKRLLKLCETNGGIYLKLVSCVHETEPTEIDPL